jgi:hypothetical protein
MDQLIDLWAGYGSTVTFAIVNAFFALSTYAVLSAGLLSFTTVVFAAVGGFLSAQMVAKFGVSLWLAFPLAAISGGLTAAVVAGASVDGWRERPDRPAEGRPVGTRLTAFGLRCRVLAPAQVVVWTRVAGSP